MAKYEFIVCTDMGVKFSKDWFSGMKNAFTYGEAIKGKYIAISHPKSSFKFGRYFTPTHDKYLKKKFLPSSRNIGFTKRVWQNAGKYPENSHTAEDTLFAINILKVTSLIPVQKGYVAWLLPNDKELAKKIQEYAKGDKKLNLFYWKYLLKRVLLIFIKNEKYFIWKNELKGYFGK